MEYQKALATILKDTFCPFCILSKDEILEETKRFMVILARAPYCKDHILIIPKRHVVFFRELKWLERRELLRLVEIWNRKLETKHEGTSILLRDGKADGKSGKSVNHLHLHIIPDCQVGVANAEFRDFFSDAKYLKETKRMREEFRNK